MPVLDPYSESFTKVTRDTINNFQRQQGKVFFLKQARQFYSCRFICSLCFCQNDRGGTKGCVICQPLVQTPASKAMKSRKKLLFLSSLLLSLLIQNRLCKIFLGFICTITIFHSLYSSSSVLLWINVVS